MKYKNITKPFFILFAVAFVSFSLLTSCDESLLEGKVDESDYVIPEYNIGYLVDGKGKKDIDFVEFRDEGTVDMYLSLTNNASGNAVASIKYDSKVLDIYNSEYNSDYALFPESLVSFEGDLEVSNGSKKSSKASVKFLTGEELDSEITYVIPVSTELKSGSITLAEKESKYLIFVKDLSKVPTAAKSTGIEIISCMEINDTNPLNNLNFTLKSNGKPLIDQVILFSANINYSSETGKVYVYNNPNVEHLLANRDKYLKPLQDRGIKVILGILGNHDRSGVANLSDETARIFAQELKAVCDAYNLDGIFYDDEYSAYQNPPPPGFVSPSAAAASRLCYETKRAMPDKLVQAYVYGLTRSLPAVDGIPSGEFVDYGIHDYRAGSDLSSNYPGMPKSRMALYSQEFNRGYWTSKSNLVNMRNNGYGAHMIFAMDPFRTNRARQITAMQDIASALFDDELVVDTNYHKKDW